MTYESKSFGEKAARSIERDLSLPAGWLDEPRSRGEAHQPAGEASGKQLDALTVPPEFLIWGDLMKPLPPVFRLQLMDNAMAPRLRAGDFVELTSGLEASSGDGVLVRDRSGGHHVRVYRQRVPGEWSAVALNEASFAPLDSARDGLQVVAVVTGEGKTGRWS